MCHFRDKLPVLSLLSPSFQVTMTTTTMTCAAYLRNPAATAVTKSSIRYERISAANDFPYTWFRSRDTFPRATWQSCNPLISLSHEQLVDNTNDTNCRRKSHDTSLGDIPFVDPHTSKRCRWSSRSWWSRGVKKSVNELSEVDADEKSVVQRNVEGRIRQPYAAPRKVIPAPFAMSRDAL